MSDFSLELNEDQLQIQKWVHDFAETVVRPAAHEWDEREETPWPIIEQAAEIGLYSWEFFANAFGDPTGLMIPIASEELFWGDAGIGLSIFGTVLGVAGIVLDDVRVPGSCLLGGKEKLDARIARAREGQSSKVQAAMATFETTRPAVGAQAVGIARAAYEYALDYAKERKQFGRAIIENQSIAFRLADMRMEIDAARLLCWRALWMSKNGKSFDAGEGSTSKLKAGEVAVW